QAAPGVKFLARGQGLGAVVGSDDIALTFLEPDGPPSTAGDDGRARIERRRRTFSSTGVHFRIKGGSLAHAVGLDEVPGRSNYFRGDDPARWHTNIRHYAGLKIPAVRPGIDLVFHGDGDRLEYDFVVAPGAEPGAIEVEFEGMSEMVIGTGGELLLRTRLGFIRQEPPVVYQEDAGQRRLLRGRCVRRGPTSVAFEVPDFDRRKPLVIDPVLSYTQVFGGSENDFTRGLAVGSNGEIVVVGTTTSPDFPAQNGYGGGGDAFVTKLSPSGAIMFSTYLGGSSFDEAGGAAVDASGAVYVAGTTGSMDFPGCPCAVGGFVAKLDVTGNLVYSNVSLAGDVRVFDLKLGPAGLLYAAGQVRAPNGWFDAFGAKLDPSSGTMTWFTRLPGDRDDFALALAVDGQGDTVLTGGTNSPGPGTNPEYDAFVARLDAGGGLIYLRYIIGTAFEEGTNVAVDGAGRAYAQIWTASTDLPTTPGAFQPASAGNYDTAVVRLDAAGAIELLTYFGGNGRDTPRGIAVDGSGAIFLAGSTQGGLPIKDAFQPTFGGPAFGTDAFVAELDPTGASLVFSSYLGSTERENAWEMALDGSGNMIVAGTVTSVFARTQIMVAKIGIAAAHIDILGSTTRWRAQRDTSKNIAVNFSGPDDLETAKLTVTEVKDSDGKPVSFPADYQPDTGTFDPTMKNADPTVSGPTYRLVWKGPWTLPNGDRLPPGNYTLVVEGTQKNQTTPMQSAPYSKVSVVEVTSVKFDAMPGAPPLEANPAVPALPGESADRARTGGGSAIFVEATDAPTDASPNPTVYDRVKVIATIEPEVTDAPADDPVRVYFRSIDVDDPIKNTPTI
ncbi:MAG TPA: SBBP repeat-containing protein, partial [Acidimicrobiales bacterium]